MHALWYLVPLADRYLPFCPILSRSTGFQMHYLNYLIFSFWTIISYYLIRWKIETSYYFTYCISTLSICCIGPGIIYNYFVYYDTIIAPILYLYLSFNYFFWKVLVILYQYLFLNLFYSLTRNDVMRMKDIQQLKIRNLWQQEIVLLLIPWLGLPQRIVQVVFLPTVCWSRFQAGQTCEILDDE